MAIRAVSHIGIGLRDLEAALPFYRDLLGMSVIIDEEERFHDPATDPPVERVRRAVFFVGPRAPKPSSSSFTRRWRPRGSASRPSCGK